MTRELGEPDHADELGGASAWWQWTAPAAGPVVFDTFRSGFSTVLAVYTGDSVGALTEVASDVDFDLTGQSMVTFAAVAGTNYRIAVHGYEGEWGNIVLNWQWTAVPTGELNLTNPTRLADGSVRFQLHGPSGQSGSIERSDATMRSWQNWRPFTLGGGPLEITDPEAALVPARFYRAVSP